MKKYFFIFFFFLLIISGVGIALITLDSINFAKNEITKYFNEKRIKEYNLIIKENKDYLFSLASYLANSPLVKKAYIKNDPKIIYNEFKVLFDSMQKKGLIKELHFFKYPAINFIDFPYNINTFDFSKKRVDILSIETAKNPGVFFYICGKYPGLRAVYPIKIDSKIVGIVSFGQDISIIIKRFKILGAKKVAILLNNKLLKYSLLPKYYEQYKNSLMNNYILLGDKIEKNRYIITTIELKDIFGNELGKLLIADDYKVLFNKILTHILLYISTFIFVLIGVLFFNIALLNYIIKELNKTNIYIQYIKNQEFDKLPSKIDVKNEIHKHQRAIIEASKEIKTLINILQSKKEEYYKKAYIDALTGAFNRRFLEEKEHELFLKYKTLQKEVAVLMLDIDNFKKINDTYGHDVGDIVLSEIGEIIKNLLREKDIFIRYGGEEFLIILEDVKLKNAIKIAEKIRETIEKKEIKIGEDKKINVTVSIGISEFRKEDKSLFDAIKRADEKLYKAKKNGKNRWEI